MIRHEEDRRTVRPPEPFGGSLRRLRSLLPVLALACCATALPAVAGASSGASPLGLASRGSGLQVTPDGQRTLISKDVGTERWAITLNDDGTVTGNVFQSAGGDPQFVSCVQRSRVDDQITFECSGAGKCPGEPCPGSGAWTVIATATLPVSFFEPPAPSAPASHDLGRALGLSDRPSGLQVTPDGMRTLVSKDVGAERWAITRNDDDTVTGNVFFSDGRDPAFIFCEQTGSTRDDLRLRCQSADRCEQAPCEEEDWTFLADVTLPRSFFAPAMPPPLPEGPLGRRRFSIDPDASFVRSLSGVGAPVEFSGFEGWIELEAGEADPASGIAIVSVVDASPVIAVEGFAPGIGSMAVCIVPTPGQFPIANAGVIDCDGGTEIGYGLVIDHNIGVVGVGGFTEQDCLQAGGVVEDEDSPHPGVCNGAFSTGPLGEDSGPGGLILAPDLIGPGGAFDVRITTETALPCGDEGVPAFDVPLVLTTGRVRTTIADERNFPGSELQTSITGENFSCAEWEEEDGPGAVSFSGFAFDYTLPAFPGLNFDAISIYSLRD